MTTRRKFIQGAVSAAVAAALPGGDGVALQSVAHPYTHKTYETAQAFAYDGTAIHPIPHEMSERMIEALCRSMAQTKERISANIFSSLGSDIHHALDLSAESLEEIEIDIPE